MAKKSKKRAGRREKDQASCMWSLLNIFDFRHVRSSQKLLLDKKRGSKRLDGAVLANIPLEALSDSCQICDERNDAVRNETSTIDISKMSVKELMEEEMCGEQVIEKQESIAVEDAKQTVDDKGPTKKNRRWTRNKMSLDLEADGYVVNGDLFGRPNHRKHKSCSNVDLNDMVEELCSHIQQKDIMNLKHFEDKHALKPIGDTLAVEKQLSEAAKVLVKHFTDGKSGGNDRTSLPTKELTEALQILNSNKELFLKLLQDPNSQLVKHIQSLQDIQIEEGKFNVLTGSDFVEHDNGNAKQPNFFWRKFNGLERNSSRKSDMAVDFSRIVVLKPGPPSSKNSDVASTCSSLPESPKSAKDKDEIQKASSPFTFAEFKRKLKLAMRKEQRDKPSEVQPNMANRDKKVSGETNVMTSPSRDHFLIDRIPKSSSGFRKGDLLPVKDPALTPEQRVSSIYIEAKRHLAEIVGNPDMDLDTHGRKVPKSLGRILSYSGYNSPTICSPRTDTRFSVDGKISSDLEEINVNLPIEVKQEPENEKELRISSKKPIEETPVIESHISDGLPAICDVDEGIHKSEVPNSEDIMTAFNAASPKGSKLLEISVDSHICSEENCHPSTSEQNTSEENEDSSTLNCSLSGKMEDLDGMSDASSRPSPISVLEPIFKEDVIISPPGIKHFTAIEFVQPRQIKFEEEISAHIGRVPSDRTCPDYDKYTFEFVKDVVQMSGLSWDELLRRSVLSNHIIKPSLIDEVDFLPDLLSCDFNLLFDLTNEVVIELCWLNFGCLLSLATPSVQPITKGKSIDSEAWKGVNRYLTLETPLRTLDQIIAKDFAKTDIWDDLRLDRENIGLLIQEAILDELLKDIMSSCFPESTDSGIPILPSAEEESEILQS